MWVRSLGTPRGRSPAKSSGSSAWGMPKKSREESRTSPPFFITLRRDLYLSFLSWFSRFDLRASCISISSDARRLVASSSAVLYSSRLPFFSSILRSSFSTRFSTLSFSVWQSSTDCCAPLVSVCLLSIAWLASSSFPLSSSISLSFPVMMLSFPVMMSLSWAIFPSRTLTASSALLRSSTSTAWFPLMISQKDMALECSASLIM
mmetsp:Transcript_13357/g.42379  ORF Transcript_13357/g.42379 Transcript_13357/m.42379 type:complete len:205 (+) Transcript_13357:217-831(+)